MRKIKQPITKLSKTKLVTIKTDKLLGFLIYHQEIFSKFKFLTDKDVLPQKDLLEEAAEIKNLEYSPLSKELKK